MSAIRFPIAANAQAALLAPLGRAERASQATLAAGGEVAFITETVGPAFATRDAALDAYPGRLDDERPGHGAAVQPEDRYLALREVVTNPPIRARKAMRPVYAEGRRWPAPPAPPKTVWRLSVSYWRLVSAAGQHAAAAPGSPRVAPRRLPPDADLEQLRARLESPMTAPKPQKALDVGLFEVRPPEAPHILMPDE